MVSFLHIFLGHVKVSHWCYKWWGNIDISLSATMVAGLVYIC